MASNHCTVPFSIRHFYGLFTQLSNLGEPIQQGMQVLTHAELCPPAVTLITALFCLHLGSKTEARLGKIKFHSK
jgi:hypothetical protein